MQTVIGLFKRFEDAQHVVQDLLDAGFRNENISLVARDENGEYSRHLEGGKKEDVSDGAATGAGIGAVLGGLGGLLLGLGALAIPGIGPVIAAGPIASALAGAGIGAVSGGLLGALVDLGIPEEHAEAYAEGLKRGGTLVVVNTDEHMSDQALMILNRHNPMDIEQERDTEVMDTSYQSTTVPVTGEYDTTDTDNPYQSDRMDVMDRGMDTNFERDRMYEESRIPVTGREDYDGDKDDSFEDNREFHHDQHMEQDENIPVTGMDTTRDIDIPVIEEDIRVGKREVERGGIHVEKRTEEVPFEQDVNLRKEDIHVERRPVDREATDEDFNAFKEGSMDFKETDEELVVDKRAHVTEEVHINKDVYDTKETVRDTLHRQDVEIHETGGQGRTGDIDWNSFDNDFRTHHRSMFGTSGRDYDYYKPAYRYGYGLASDERFRDYDWNRLEPQARSDWESRGGQGAWEDVKDAVRHAWERVRH